MILLLASHNPHKKKEILKVLPGQFQIKDLNDIGFFEEIKETGKTLEENALIKVRYLHDRLKLNCIAEDSGLEIECLDGAPGVYSARYAGEPKNDLQNIQLVLNNMKDELNRKAQFRTVIAVRFGDKEYLFEGTVKGEIALSPRGEHGFGYDPIFIPESFNQTFAELGDEIKAKISHRSKAVLKLLDFLEKQT